MFSLIQPFKYSPGGMHIHDEKKHIDVIQILKHCIEVGRFRRTIENENIDNIDCKQLCFA